MCGVVGIWTRDGRGLERVTRVMADRLAHRGPDASGVWVDEGAGIALGHRRLAIVDLSDSGAQPMHSEGGRYVISFNGEIYNHADLRRELEMSGRAPMWRGSSDTETLLAGFASWGIEETLRRTVGMFAIALWDREERSLTLMRDRYGEKPLYFGTVGEGASSSFAFASELKALRALPNFANEIDRKSVAQMLQISVVAAPRTIYRDIHQLKPGHLVTMWSAP